MDALVVGVILSGSPFSVLDNKSPHPDLSQIKGKLPLLGICFGAQFLSHITLGEKYCLQVLVNMAGHVISKINADETISQGMTSGSQVWMSHGDTIKSIPDNYSVFASTEDVEVAGYSSERRTDLRCSISPRGIPFHGRKDFTKKLYR